MLLRSFLLLLVMAFGTNGAYAAEVEQTLMFSEIVKEDSSSEKYCSSVSDSGMCLMTQKNAIDYCVSQGQSLPSSREFVQLAVSFGAEGIVTEDDPSTNLPIVAKNLDGTVDKFIYGFTGYVQPDGELGRNLFWTSSSPDIESLSYGLAFGGDFGMVDHVYLREDYHPVLCAAKNDL